MSMMVLVADDDPTLRMLMLDLLQTEMGFEVLEAQDGLAAWQLLNRFLLGLVLPKDFPILFQLSGKRLKVR